MEVSAAPDGSEVYVCILFEQDYGTPITGWSKAEKICEENSYDCKDEYKFAWLKYVGDSVYDTSQSWELNFDTLNGSLTSYGKKIKSLHTKDANGNTVATFTTTKTFSWTDTSMFGTLVGIGTYNGDYPWIVTSIYPFYIEWDETISTITYYDGGDSDGVAYSGSNSSSLLSSYTEGGTATLVDGVKTGYDFGGWYDNKECTGTAVESISASDTGNKTFYAKWTPQVYDIKYYYYNTSDEFTDDDWGGVAHPTTHTYGTETKLAMLPTKTNYTFVGWSAYADGNFVKSLGATDYTKKIELYGYFSKTSSTLTIDVTVTGVPNSAIVIYILKNGAMQSQIVALGNDTISYTYAVDTTATYTLLVCKPYMWTMTASGLTATGNKIEFVATTDDRALTLAFSGSGTTINMLVI